MLSHLNMDEQVEQQAATQICDKDYYTNKQCDAILKERDEEILQYEGPCPCNPI